MSHTSFKVIYTLIVFVEVFVRKFKNLTVRTSVRNIPDTLLNIALKNAKKTQK